MSSVSVVRRLWIALISLFLVAVAGLPSGFADVPGPIAETEGEVVDRDPLLRRHMLWGGIDLGFSTLSTDVATELDKDGFHLNLKLLYSYAWEKWAIDGGLGWFYNRISGDATAPPVTNEKISTKAGILEITPRYRLTPRWSVGPSMQLMVGADTDFDTVGVEEKSVTTLLGLQGVYTFFPEFPIRLVGSFYTDVDIKNRQHYFFLAGVQVAFPLDKLPLRGPKVTHSGRSVRVRFELRHLYFDFDKDEVKPQGKAYLKNVAAVLTGNDRLWKQLRIEGHTDNRGTWEYNLDLSQRRARSALRELERNGVPKKRMETAGHSFDRPLVNENHPSAWAKNRRVELHFEKLENAEKLARKLQQKLDEAAPKEP